MRLTAAGYAKLRKDVDRTLDRVNQEITNLSSGDRYARGLAAEGYAGGYRDALHDFLLVMNGVVPTNSRYWKGST